MPYTMTLLKVKHKLKMVGDFGGLGGCGPASDIYSTLTLAKIKSRIFNPKIYKN
jgi:hypothetical protein